MKTREFWTLRAAALQWLRYERQCPLVALERGPVDGRPDVLGMTKDRRLIEIEIKRSRGDFRADRVKRKHKRSTWQHAAQFYWFVPPAMVEWARGELREGEGLMTYGTEISLGGIPLAVIAVRARRRSKKRLDNRQLVLMAKAQAGTLVAFAGVLMKSAARGEKATELD